MELYIDQTKKNEELKKKNEELEECLKKMKKDVPMEKNQDYDNLKVKFEKAEIDNRNMSLEIVKLQKNFENFKTSSKNEVEKLNQTISTNEKEKKVLLEKMKKETEENKIKTDRITHLEALIRNIHKISSLDGKVLKEIEVLPKVQEYHQSVEKIEYIEEIRAPLDEEPEIVENPFKRKLSSQDLTEEPETKKKEVKVTTKEALEEFIMLNDEEYQMNMIKFCQSLWSTMNKKEVQKFIKGISKFIGEYIEKLNSNPSKMSNLIYMLYMTSPKDIDLMKLLYNYLANSVFKKKNIENSVFYFSSGLGFLSNMKYKKGDFCLETALRVLCYDLLKEKLSSSIRIIHFILGANPKILKSSSQSLLTLTIRSIINDLKKSSVSLHQNEIEACQKIEKIYDWNSEDSKSIDELIDILIEAIRDSESPDPNLISEKDFEIIKSLELIASLKSWQWTYTELITKKLWQLMKPPQSDSDQRRSIVLFTLLGNLGKLGLNKSDNGIDELRKRLAIVISEKGSKLFSLEAQISAANGLVELSLEKFENLENVFLWFDKKDFKYLPHKLKSIYTTYQESKQFIIPKSPISPRK